MSPVSRSIIPSTVRFWNGKVREVAGAAGVGVAAAGTVGVTDGVTGTSAGATGATPVAILARYNVSACFSPNPNSAELSPASASASLLKRLT